MAHNITNYDTLYYYPKYKRMLGKHLKEMPWNYNSNRSSLQFLTLTFSQKYHKKKLESLWMATIPVVVRNLRRIAPNMFSIWSELTDQGILHYHIICKHHNYLKMKVFRAAWYRTYGITDLSFVKPSRYLHVFTYCRKESWEMMHTVLPTRFIAYNSKRIMYSVPNQSTCIQVLEWIHKRLLNLEKKRKRTKAVEDLGLLLMMLGPQAQSPAEEAERSDSE